jgi:NADP-dependent 3-hydroxy acid dehydrogenase YdfG
MEDFLMLPAKVASRVVIVTGAPAGVGRGVAHRFASAGGRIGKVDIWINDAMETVFSPLAEMTPAEFDE